MKKSHFSYLTLIISALFISLALSWPISAAQPEGLRKSKTTSKTVKKAPVKQKSVKTYKVVGKKTTTKSSKYAKKTVTKRYAPAVVHPSPKAVLAPKFVKIFNSPTDPLLERANFSVLNSNEVRLNSLPRFSSSYRGRVVGLTPKNEFVLYSLDSDLQEYANQIVEKVAAPHVAVVAMEPSSGRILAIAGKSSSLQQITTHAGFPAASLIKSITAAAAVEHGGMSPNREIFFRGGTYELGINNYNHSPNDKNSLTASEALGKSCNPVFSRIALSYLNPALLRAKINSFGFNNNLKLQAPLATSMATIPNGDYEFGRTAAGFGAVYISPVHAASVMSAFANHGTLLQPSIIDKVINQTGDYVYEFKPYEISRPISPQTAKTLMQMMVSTTVTGTSKKEFLGRVPWDVAGKTGTLRGSNPVGLNTWFIGAAPLNNPRIAISVIVLDPAQTSSKPSHIARLILQRYLG